MLSVDCFVFSNSRCTLGLLTLVLSYPRTRREKYCRSLSSSTLRWFTWVCAGSFLFSLWVRIFAADRSWALLRQRESSVSSYSIEFRTLAASCGWNDKALWDHFLHGLAEHIKDEIYSLELPSSLDGLIDLAIRVDNRISLRSRHQRSGFPPELSH